MSYKISEDHEILLPKFVAYGGFTLSHTSKPVTIEDQDAVDKFLPPLPDERGWPHIFLDPERPMMHGNLIMPSGFYNEFRLKIHYTHTLAKQKIKEVTSEFEKNFGRSYGNGLIEEYQMKDAEVAILNYGELAMQMEDAVDALRNEGYKVGCVKLRYFRPFPVEDIIQIANKVKVLGVADRATAFGSPTGGPVSSEVKAALYGSGAVTKVLPIVMGLGGREVSLEQQKDQLKVLNKLNETGEFPKDMIEGTFWDGLLEVD
jgi:pyruvate ferredoxin oxidoreductase alpha subunit